MKVGHKAYSPSPEELLLQNLQQSLGIGPPFFF